MQQGQEVKAIGAGKRIMAGWKEGHLYTILNFGSQWWAGCMCASELAAKVQAIVLQQLSCQTHPSRKHHHGQGSSAENWSMKGVVVSMLTEPVEDGTL